MESIQEEEEPNNASRFDNTLIRRPPRKSMIPTPLPSNRPLALSTPYSKPRITPSDPPSTLRRSFAPESMDYSKIDQYRPGIQIAESILPDILTLPTLFRSAREGNINFTRNSLTNIRENYVHFISSDVELVTPISKLLVAIGAISIENLRNTKPKEGQVLVTPRGKYKIFSVIIKERHYDDTSIAKLVVLWKI